MGSSMLPFLYWIFGVGPVLFVVALGIGGGLTLALAPQIRNIRLAHWFFGFAWVWAFGGIIEVIGDMKLTPKLSIPLAFVCTGVIGVLALMSSIWVERNHHDSTVDSGVLPHPVTLSGTVTVVDKSKPNNPPPNPEPSPTQEAHPSQNIQPSEPSNRPWLTLEARANSALTYEADGGVKITVIFGYRNAGQSPAQEVWFHPKMFAYDGKKSPIEERDRFCLETATNQIRKSLGKTIFPGDGDGVNFTFGLNKTEIDAAMANFDRHLLPLAIIGCVGYTVPGSPKPHYTGIFLDIHKHSDQVPQGVVPPPYEDVPLASLMLVPSPLGGGVTSK